MKAMTGAYLSKNGSVWNFRGPQRVRSALWEHLALAFVGAPLRRKGLERGFPWNCRRKGDRVGGYRLRVYKHVRRAVLLYLLLCPFEEELFWGEECCWMGDLICFLCFLLAWTGQVALTHKVLDRLKGNPFADGEDTLWDKEENVLLTASSSAWLWL